MHIFCECAYAFAAADYLQVVHHTCHIYKVSRQYECADALLDADYVHIVHHTCHTYEVVHPL